MSGTFTVFPVIAGLLSSTLGNLFTSSTTSSYLKQALFFNQSSVQVSFVVYLAPSSGSNVPFRRVTLKPNESYKLLEHGESITLDAGDSFAAVADTDQAIAYLITGVNET